MIGGRAPERARAPAAARWRVAAALTLPLLLAACGAALDTYDLSAAMPPPQRPLRAQLRVAEPLASTDLDSARILVRAGPQQLATLAGAKWPDRLPAVLQARLIQSFENAGLAPQVSRRPTAPSGYELQLDIRHFELVVARSRIEIDIAAKIVSASGGVAGAQVFTAEAPVASTAPANVSAAMNGALSSVMARIVAFTAARI
jgi:cholesterol transport system auxiliary component